MFPISDENPTRITPYVTYALIVVNVIVFLFELTLSQQNLQDFLYSWAMIPCQLTNICSVPLPVSSHPEALTLITSQFLHGGWMHLLGNMLFLWIFGNNIEDCLGHFKFIIFYLTCGIFAALTQWFFSTSSAIPSLGASGSIAGILGAYILRYPKAQILTIIPLGIPIPVRVSALFFLGIWFLQQALYSLATLSVPMNVGLEGGIAYWAHSGGFVVGIILGPLLGLFANQE